VDLAHASGRAPRVAVTGRVAVTAAVTPARAAPALGYKWYRC